MFFLSFRFLYFCISCFCLRYWYILSALFKLLSIYRLKIHPPLFNVFSVSSWFVAVFLLRATESDICVSRIPDRDEVSHTSVSPEDINQDKWNKWYLSIWVEQQTDTRTVSTEVPLRLSSRNWLCDLRIRPGVWVFYKVESVPRELCYRFDIFTFFDIRYLLGDEV